MDPPVHNFYDYDQTLDLPAAGCLPLGFGDPTNRKLGVDYAESVRVGDFNGDGLQDLLLLNVEVDVGTEIYSRSLREHTGELFVCGGRTVCNNCDEDHPCGCGSSSSGIGCKEFNRRKEVGRAHYNSPVLLMATGGLTTGPGFVPVVLPLSGGRFQRSSTRRRPAS